MQRLYLFITPKDLVKFTSNESKFIFYLVYLHCVIVKRQRYVPETWTKKYEFSQSDFIFAFESLKFLKLKEPNENIIPKFKNLLCSCIYGSKIDVEQD